MILSQELGGLKSHAMRKTFIYIISNGKTQKSLLHTRLTSDATILLKTFNN